jgi:hypothetical protein
MKKGIYTAAAQAKNGVFKTLYIEAENEQEAEHQARSKAKAQGLKFIIDSVDFDPDDENNFGINF